MIFAPMGIVIVADADPQNSAEHPIAVRPVGEGVADHLGVGDDHRLVIEGLHGQRAHADAGDFAQKRADLDDIAGSQRSFRSAAAGR